MWTGISTILLGERDGVCTLAAMNEYTCGGPHDMSVDALRLTMRSQPDDKKSIRRQ